MKKQNQAKIEIPNISYEVIEYIKNLKANGREISAISKSVNLSPETVMIILQDYYKNYDIQLELMSSIDTYHQMSNEISLLAVIINNYAEKKEEDPNIPNLVKLFNQMSKIENERIKLLMNIAKNPKLQMEKFQRSELTIKQKEVLKILEKFGEADKVTIGKNMKPPVSATRVHHLLHGKKGTAGLLDKVPGIIYRREGNKNIYQLLYRVIDIG